MIKKIIQDIEFWKLLISVTTPVLVALIGLWVFKKQGQHNLIRKRYLEEGFDQLIDEYEKAMFTYRHNWALSIEVLRQIKNLPKEFVSENSINEFIGLGPQVLPTTAVHRVNKIFNNKKLWELH